MFYHSKLENKVYLVGFKGHQIRASSVNVKVQQESMQNQGIIIVLWAQGLKVIFLGFIKVIRVTTSEGVLYQPPRTSTQVVGVPILLLVYHDLINNTNDQIMGHLDSLKFYTYSNHQGLFLGYHAIGHGTEKSKETTR